MLTRAASQSEPPVSGWAVRISRWCAARMSASLAPGARPSTSVRFLARHGSPARPRRRRSTPGCAGPARASPQPGGMRGAPAVPYQRPEQRQRTECHAAAAGQHQQQDQAEAAQHRNPHHQRFHRGNGRLLEGPQTAEEQEQHQSAEHQPEHAANLRGSASFRNQRLEDDRSKARGSAPGPRQGALPPEPPAKAAPLQSIRWRGWTGGGRTVTGCCLTDDRRSGSTQ